MWKCASSLRIILLEKPASIFSRLRIPPTLLHRITLHFLPILTSQLSNCSFSRVANTLTQKWRQIQILIFTRVASRHSPIHPNADILRNAWVSFARTFYNRIVNPRVSSTVPGVNWERLRRGRFLWKADGGMHVFSSPFRSFSYRNALNSSPYFRGFPDRPSSPEEIPPRSRG